MKLRLNYITISAWWDTDITLLPSFRNEGIYISLIVINPYCDSKFSESEIVDFCKSSNIFHSIIKRKRKIRHISNLKVAIDVLKILRKKKSSDDWTFFEYFSDPYLNILLLLFNRKKTIVSFHDYNEHIGTRQNIFDKMLRSLTLNFFKHFHFHSEEEFKKFKLNYPNKNCFFTIMPLKDFGLPKIKIIKDKDKKTFLFFGYIKKYKNLTSLILAFESLNRSDVKLIIAGHCNDFSMYNELIKTKSLYDLNIRFIENHEIPVFFNKADYLVLPYLDSTQSGPFLIALNYNLPVISSNTGSFANLIENKVDGLIFDFQQENSFTETLNFACEMEENCYQKIKRNQKIKADRYSILSQNNGYKLKQYMTTSF